MVGLGIGAGGLDCRFVDVDRVNPDRGTDENLNSPGSTFVPLAFAGSNQFTKPGAKTSAAAPNRFYMYGVIARPAMVAASYELEATDPDAETYE